MNSFPFLFHLETATQLRVYLMRVVRGGINENNTVRVFGLRDCQWKLSVLLYGRDIILFGPDNTDIPRNSLVESLQIFYET